MGSLLYHAGALGDFITALPALQAWRRLHIGDRIVLLGKPAFAALLSKKPPFDEVWDVESVRFSSLFSADPGRELAPLFGSFTSALLFSPDSSPLSANLARLGAVGIIRQDPFPSTPVPIVEHHLSLFRGLPLGEDERAPRIDVLADAAPEPRGAVALHPGSGSLAKNWPRERFLALSLLFRSSGERTVWIAGPAETGLALPAGEWAWRDLSLPALASGLARSRLFVGNDSGVSHLAAAVGCPTVALFGASDPAVWAPRGGRVRILHGETMEDIALESVAEVCRSLLAG